MQTSPPVSTKKETTPMVWFFFFGGHFVSPWESSLVTGRIHSWMWTVTKLVPAGRYLPPARLQPPSSLSNAPRGTAVSHKHYLSLRSLSGLSAHL